LIDEMWRLSLMVLAACAGAEAMSAPPSGASKPEFELGLHPGESMAYEVRLAGMLAGEAQLAVGEIGNINGRRALVVMSRAATAGAAALIKRITDEATTVIDAETGRPISLETVVDIAGKRTFASATFAGRFANVTYRREDEAAPHATKIDFGTEALHDTHTAMAALRGWRAVPGTQRTVYVVGGRRLWRIDVTYAGGETIGTPVGNRRAVIYDGSSYRAKRDLSIESSKPARSFRVWLSDDGDRVPLKVTARTELGDVVMDLTEYNRP
jgi:hypothetical protein